MGPPENNISIQQAVHGYLRGHRLLASSTNLPDPAARALLLMSDLSGSNIVPGFETYLTGYPLGSSTGTYVLARTWYAPEMPRPGCVWTHSLFIGKDDLSKIKQPSELISLFVRPKPTDNLAIYQNPITYTVTEPFDAKLQFRRAQAADLIEIFYGQPGWPILIPSDCTADCESLVLSLWSQQWPRLRTATRFCTGSLASRSLEGGIFDIQIVPSQNTRQIVRQLRNEAIALAAPNLKAIDFEHVEQWVRTGVDDLDPINGSEFRNWLWDFSEDLTIVNQRSLYQPLAKCFSLHKNLQNDDQLEEQLVALLGESFPRSTEGVRIKQLILGRRHLSEGRVLRAFAFSRHSQAFSFQGLDLHQRAQEIWNTAPDEAARLFLDLATSGTGTLATVILSGLLEGVELSRLLKLSDDVPDLIGTAIRQKPALVGTQRLWRAAESLQRHAFRSFLATSEVEHLLPIAIRAMLEAGSGACAELAFHSAPRRLSSVVLDWFNTLPRQPKDLPLDWQDVLSRSLPAVIEWLRSVPKASSAMLTLVARVLAGKFPEIVNYGAQPWLRHLDVDSLEPAGADTDYLAVFLLSIALKSDEAIGAVLAIWTFERVHAISGATSHPSSGWGIIEPLLPRVADEDSWDRCERLRQALIRAFIHHDWDRKLFLSCVKREESLDKLLRSCSKVEGGKSLLNPGKKWSFFISYAHKDETFAERLFSEMRNANLRVWYAPQELKGGLNIQGQIEMQLHMHDKVLLLLSDASMQSAWVKAEIRHVRRREKKEKRQILYPIALSPAEEIRRWKSFDADTGKDVAREIREYHILDFSHWKDHEKFKVAFDRLLRDLQAGPFILP